jgi:hypothetical protein
MFQVFLYFFFFIINYNVYNVFQVIIYNFNFILIFFILFLCFFRGTYVFFLLCFLLCLLCFFSGGRACEAGEVGRWLGESAWEKFLAKTCQDLLALVYLQACPGV